MIVGPDGTLRVRGRITAKDRNVVFDTPIFCWAGTLLGGYREIWIATQTGTGEWFELVDTVNGGSLGAIAVNGLVKVAGAAVVQNALILAPPDPHTDGLWVYGGSLKTATYTPNNCTTTEGSRTITRAAGGFSANVDAGMVLTITDAGSADSYSYAIVQKVVSNTEILLDRPYHDATSAGAATLTFSPVLRMRNSTIAPHKWIYPMTPLFNELAGRWISYGGVPGDDEQKPTTMSFSAGPDPDTALISPTWDVQNRHNFPPDAGGVAVRPLRDREFLFTSRGVYVLSNMNLEITDLDGNPQHPIEEYSREMIAVTNSGIATWQNALIVPCRDAIYVTDGISAPISISGGIPWAQHVSDGAVIGWATVHRGYYLLPITVGGETFTYVIRLAGAASPTGAVYFPTTRIVPCATAVIDPTRAGANTIAWASAGASSLLALGKKQLMEATGMFNNSNPGAAGDDDNHAGGSIIQPQARKWFELGTKATVRRIRLRYRLVSASPDVGILVIPGDNTVGGVATLVTSESDGNGWIAIDLPQAVEAHSVGVSVFLLATPEVFELTGIEVQYRAFGGGL